MDYEKREKNQIIKIIILICLILVTIIGCFIAFKYAYHFPYSSDIMRNPRYMLHLLWNSTRFFIQISFKFTLFKIFDGVMWFVMNVLLFATFVEIILLVVNIVKIRRIGLDKK